MFNQGPVGVQRIGGNEREAQLRASVLQHVMTLAIPIESWTSAK